MRRDQAIRSGAQFVSTDYPAPVQPSQLPPSIKTGYQVNSQPCAGFRLVPPAYFVHSFFLLLRLTCVACCQWFASKICTRLAGRGVQVRLAPRCNPVNGPSECRPTSNPEQVRCLEKRAAAYEAR
jgi:hypothetical protein